MNFTMTIKIAWKNIVSNRLRSGLTILGLVIGIASVIILVGIGNGASRSVQSQVASLGTDIITVQISDSDSALSYEEVSGLKGVEGVAEVSPYQMLSATLSSGSDTSARAGVYAAGEAFTDMMGFKLKSGREMSRIDVDNSSKVVIIGSDVASEFWGTLDPCGDNIRINGDSYRVIGVLDSVGSSMGNNIDEAVLIPITTARYLGVSTSISNLYVRAESESAAEAAAENVKNHLTGDLGISEDYVSSTTQSQMLDAMKDINNTLSLLLGGIAGISLLVGGIGVMNVMLVSVTERTREIGIRKSLGAKKRDILFQFLLESMVLSVFGGLIGIVAGFAGGEIAALLGATFAPGVGMVILSVAVSIAVGLIFGIFPSYRAAGLKPVEALRYE